MPLPRVRFSIGRLMIAVVIFAVLTPFPGWATQVVFTVCILVGVPFLVLIFAIDFLVPKGAGHVAAAVLLGSLWLGIFLLLSHFRLDLGAPAAAVSGFTVANVAGPAYVLQRKLRDQSLTAGHLLWVWSGLLWLAYPLVGNHREAAMVEFCRLTLAITVLAAIYGPRPKNQSEAWGHYVGWFLIECQVIVWGWQAARSLR